MGLIRYDRLVTLLENRLVKLYQPMPVDDFQAGKEVTFYADFGTIRYLFRFPASEALEVPSWRWETHFKARVIEELAHEILGLVSVD